MLGLQVMTHPHTIDLPFSAGMVLGPQFTHQKWPSHGPILEVVLRTPPATGRDSASLEVDAPMPILLVILHKNPDVI